MSVPDILVIGAGPAGMMSAVQAARDGASVTIIERNERPGRKLMITGKGRCNLTNAQPLLNELISNVPVNGRFLFGAFSRYMPQDVMDFFEDEGVPLKVERGDRVFPVSDRASDIVDALYEACLDEHVDFVRGRVTSFISDGKKISAAESEDGDTFKASSFILATGGKSYPQTGSTGDGYTLAQALGHTIVTPKPSLVPLECHEGFCSDLMGLSLRNIGIKVEDTVSGGIIYEDFGEMLFTHFGVSGPVVLSASSHMREMDRNRYVIHIDLKPALSYEQLDRRIVRDFTDNANKDYINSLSLLLPRKLIPVIAKLSGIKPTIKTNQITREQRAQLVNLLKDFRVTVTGFRPIEEAIITSGGISVNEIDPKTLRSKLIDNLFFAGEIIDADAYTGGFNLQIAFSTGYSAGKSAADLARKIGS